MASTTSASRRRASVVSYGEQRRDGQLIECDTMVLCAGQEPLRELEAPLRAAGVAVHLIGGALEAGELDAKRAIDQGTRLALTLDQASGSVDPEAGPLSRCFTAPSRCRSPARRCRTTGAPSALACAPSRAPAALMPWAGSGITTAATIAASQGSSGVQHAPWRAAEGRASRASAQNSAQTSPTKSPRWRVDTSVVCPTALRFLACHRRLQVDPRRDRRYKPLVVELRTRRSSSGRPACRRPAS